MLRGALGLRSGPPPRPGRRGDPGGSRRGGLVGNRPDRRPGPAAPGGLLLLPALALAAVDLAQQPGLDPPGAAFTLRLAGEHVRDARQARRDLATFRAEAARDPLRWRDAPRRAARARRPPRLRQVLRPHRPRQPALRPHDPRHPRERRGAAGGGRPRRPLGLPHLARRGRRELARPRHPALRACTSTPRAATAPSWPHPPHPHRPRRQRRLARRGGDARDHPLLAGRSLLRPHDRPHRRRPRLPRPALQLGDHARPVHRSPPSSACCSTPAPAPAVFAEIALISSHAPWTPIPPLLPWDALGDGTVFDPYATAGDPPHVVWRDRDRVRDQFRRALDYTLAATLAFTERRAPTAPLVILLGDHQPAAFVSEGFGGRSVPVHLIGPPEVLALTSGWGWTDGLIPDPSAPVWPMEAFRDRFLDAFAAAPACGGPPPDPGPQPLPDAPSC